MRKPSLFVLLFFSILCEALATDIVVRVVPVNTSLDTLKTHSYNVKVLRFYLSEITFMKNKDTIWTEPETYRLVDLADSSSFNITSYVPDGLSYDAIRFRLGVDSVSSSTGAHKGALDPANGMYWAWHTGYVNLKVEGTCTACPPPKNEFEFHIGGYQSPFNAEREITLNTNTNGIHEVFFDVSGMLNEAFSVSQYRILTPSAAAMRMADAAAKSFYIKP